MISFLSAWIFGVAVAASVAITVLHFLSVRRPPVYALPTARFVVARNVRAVSRSARPSDLVLLALRVLALLAAGAALAGPRWISQRDGVAHILVADPSWRPDSVTLRRIAGLDASPARAGDDAVRIVWTDSVRGMRMEFGAAWPVVWQSAGELLRDDPSLDSVSVHVFAPERGSVSYAGWNAWRSTWPGSVRVHLRESVALSRVADTSRVATRGGSPSASHVGDVTPVLLRDSRGDDAVRAAFALHLGIIPRSPASDSVPRSGSATVRIDWPASGVPTGWARTRDTVGALVAGGRAIVAPWLRESRAPPSLPASASVIARWGDGTPAAIEYARAGGCDRVVGVSVPNASDVLNTPAAGALVRVLSAPCGLASTPVPLAIARDSGVQSLSRQSLASAGDLHPLLPARAAVLPRWLPAALLVLALLLLAIEQLLRRTASAAVSELA